MLNKNLRRQNQQKIFAGIRLILSLILVITAFAYGGEMSAYLSNFAISAVGLGTLDREAPKEQNKIKTKEDEKQNEEIEDAKLLLNTEKDYLTQTPKDVLANMLNIKDSKNISKGGTAQETTFTKNDATNVYKNISLKNSTGQNIEIETLLQNRLELKLTKNKPLVLVYHTHTSESYNLFSDNVFEKGYTGRSLDENKNMIRIGKEIVGELEKSGIIAIHDTDIHDESYNDSYDHSREAIKKHLEEHPSIQITLDVHRDAIHYDSQTYCKPVANVLGKQAAQVMILTGAEGGRVESFPNWQQNLNFALQLQNYSESLFSGLMRPIMFCQRKYNLDLGKYSLLLEMGTDANTLEEAVYSGRLIGNALSKLILDAYEESI